MERVADLLEELPGRGTKGTHFGVEDAMGSSTISSAQKTGLDDKAARLKLVHAAEARLVKA